MRKPKLALDAAEMKQANGVGRARTRAGKLRLPSLDDLDKRTAAYRDATDLIDRVIGERGGRDQVDVVRAASAETWAVLTTQLRALQVQWLNGGCVDWTEFTTIANARRREGDTLGNPEARDITPTWGDVFQANVDRTLTPQDKAIGVGRDGLSPVEREQFDAWRKTVEQENAANDR